MGCEWISGSPYALHGIMGSLLYYSPHHSFYKNLSSDVWSTSSSWRRLFTDLSSTMLLASGVFTACFLTQKKTVCRFVCLFSSSIHCKVLIGFCSAKRLISSGLYMGEMLAMPLTVGQMVPATAAWAVPATVVLALFSASLHVRRLQGDATTAVPARLPAAQLASKAAKQAQFPVDCAKMAVAVPGNSNWCHYPCLSAHSMAG